MVLLKSGKNELQLHFVATGSKLFVNIPLSRYLEGIICQNSHNINRKWLNNQPNCSIQGMELRT